MEKMLFNLTEVEFKELLNSAVEEKIKELIGSIKPISTKQRKRIAGIQGLATYVGCALATAQKMKNSGTIPFYTAGTRVFFYSDEVDESIKGRA